jgi:DNA-binding transcriptional MerR regulator
MMFKPAHDGLQAVTRNGAILGQDRSASGQRLFEHDDHVAKVQLITGTATTGVMLAHHQPIYQPIVQR